MVISSAKLPINNDQKIKALSTISNVLAKKSKVTEGAAILKRTLDFRNGIEEYEKSKAIVTFSKVLVKQGNLENAIRCARNINRDHDFGNTFIHFKKC